MTETPAPGAALCRRLAPWLLLPLGLLPTLGALGAPFMTSYDDIWVIEKNPLLVHGWGYLPKLFTEGRLETGHMQLAYLSVALDCTLFGQSATALRLVNALLHGLSALLVFRIGSRLLRGREPAALLAALLFAVHPTAVETVAWVIQRNNALAQFLGLAALAVYLGPASANDSRGPSWRRLLAAAGLLLLAQFSKTAAAGWGGVFVLLEVLLFEGARWHRAVRAGVMLLPCLAGAYMAVTAHAEQWVPVLGEPSWLGRVAGMLHLHGRAWGLMLWPFGLSAFYHVSPAVSWLDAGVALALLIPLAWLALSAWLELPLRRALLLLGWAIGFLLPTMNPFIGISFTLQDRYLYFSLVPVCLLCGELVLAAAARLSSPRPALTAAAGIAALLGVCAMARSLDWRDAGRLFHDATLKQPASAFGHAYLASFLFFRVRPDMSDSDRRKLLELSLREHEAALRCDDFERLVYPLYLRNEHGRVLLMLGRKEEARQFLTSVLDGRPERAVEAGAKMEALRHLAFEALDSARYQEGLAYVERGLRQDPGHPALLISRLAAWRELGRADDARREARRLAADAAFQQRVRQYEGGLLLPTFERVRRELEAPAQP